MGHDVLVATLDGSHLVAAEDAQARSHQFEFCIVLLTLVQIVCTNIGAGLDL